MKKIDFLVSAALLGVGCALLGGEFGYPVGFGLFFITFALLPNRMV